MSATKHRYSRNGVRNGKATVKLDMAAVAVAATYNVMDSVGIYFTRPSSALDEGVFWTGLSAAIGSRAVRNWAVRPVSSWRLVRIGTRCGSITRAKSRVRRSVLRISSSANAAMLISTSVGLHFAKLGALPKPQHRAD